MRSDAVLIELSKSPTTAEHEGALQTGRVKDLLDISDAILDKFESPNVRYRCRHDDCELYFKRRDQLHAHEYTHTARKIFSCPEMNCLKSYVNNAHLQRHIQTSHQKRLAESILCKFGPPCLRSYKSKEKMLSHYQKAHIDKTDIKSLSFPCDLCPEVFRRKAQHRQHMFSHTGNYPYTCQHCQRGFMNRYNLVRHENSHRIYKCGECPLEFLKWSLLVAHRHSEHPAGEPKCTICGREFQSKRGLKHHRTVHEEIANRDVLQCPFDKCPSFFFHQRNLNGHIRTKHEGVKFICDIGGCGKNLCSKQKLIIHMKVVHLNVKVEQNGAKKGPRKPRKDKGLPKVSMAAKLAGIHMPKEVDRMVLAGQGHKIQFDYGSVVDSLESVETSQEKDLN